MSRPFEFLRRMSVLQQKQNRLRMRGQDIAQLNRCLILKPLSESVARISGGGSVREDVDFRLIHHALEWVTEQVGEDTFPGIEFLNRVQQELLCDRSVPPLRTGSTRPICPEQKMFESVLIPRALERFQDWIQSDGYREMHPLEQLTASQVRLCEVQPFESSPFLTAWIFSLRFLADSGHLMPVYDRIPESRFTDAICEGFRMSTLPLLSLHLEACGRALEIVEQHQG